MNHWWQAPEYDKRAPMDYPDGRAGPQRRVGVDVQFDTALLRWVSAPIRIYVGPSHV